MEVGRPPSAAGMAKTVHPATLVGFAMLLRYWRWRCLEMCPSLVSNLKCCSPFFTRGQGAFPRILKRHFRFGDCHLEGGYPVCCLLLPLPLYKPPVGLPSRPGVVCFNYPCLLLVVGLCALSVVLCAGSVASWLHCLRRAQFLTPQLSWSALLEF